MENFFDKLRGDNTQLPPLPSRQNILLAWLGGFITIGLIAGLSQNFQVALILGSFGASCVLVFGFPDAPFSQPRNLVLGHFLSSLVGLSFLALFGATWWALALAVATAIALMMATRTVHPPAGSNPVIVFLMCPSWEFLLFPTLSGSLLILLVALVYLNLSRNSNYPKYW